jgi:hypothetical protein
MTGVCARTISRWQEDPKLGFPEPIRINNNRFWRLSDLEQEAPHATSVTESDELPLRPVTNGHHPQEVLQAAE